MFFLWPGQKPICLFWGPRIFFKFRLFFCAIVLWSNGNFPKKIFFWLLWFLNENFAAQTPNFIRHKINRYKRFYVKHKMSRSRFRFCQIFFRRYIFKNNFATLFFRKQFDFLRSMLNLKYRHYFKKASTNW